MPLAIVRSSATRIADMNLIYGVEGIGKTKWAGDADNPVAADVERRLGHLDINCVPVKSAADVREVVADHLGPPCQSFIVDGADALDALFQKEVCAENHWDNIESPGYGKGFAPLVNKWIEFINLLVAIRERGIEVNITAHAVVKPHNNPEGPDYDRYVLELPKKVAALLKARCTNVFFAHYEDVATKGKNELKAKAVSTGRRIIETCHKAAWDAKNSYDLTGAIELDYNVFRNARNAWLAARGSVTVSQGTSPPPEPRVTSAPATVPASTHTIQSVSALLQQWMANGSKTAMDATAAFIKPVIGAHKLAEASPPALDEIATLVGKEL